MPDSMTEAEFLAAARKGHGRAIQALRDGDVHPSLPALRRLVLRWPGLYDRPTCESTRGWYTVELMTGSPHEVELSSQVIRHLDRMKGGSLHIWHREATVLELAKRGSSSARDALYARYDPADEFRFAREIIELDGLGGLGWLISHSADHLVPDNAWTFHWWFEDLEEVCAKEVASEWLARESAHRPEVAEFARLLSLWETRPTPSKEARVALTYEVLRKEWFGPGTKRTSVRLWAQTAGPEELAIAWRAFESEKDPDWLRRLARGLKRKPKHCNFVKLQALARAWNDERNPFASALENVVGPRTRQLAFDLIASGWIVDGIGLLAKNALPEDGPAILEAARTLADVWDIHGVGLDLLQIADRMEATDCLLWVYESTPCSFCRESAVRKLIETGHAPDALLQECFLDCAPDTREMAAKALKGPLSHLCG